MNKLQHNIDEAGKILNLPLRNKSKYIYGYKNDLLVQMGIERFLGGLVFVSIILWNDPQKDDLVRERLQKSTKLKEVKISHKHIHIRNGAAKYVKELAFEKTPSTKIIVLKIETLLSEIKEVTNSFLKHCSKCKIQDCELVLINDKINLICSKCLDGLRSEIKKQEIEYNSKPIPWIKIILTSFLTIVFGLLIWLFVAGIAYKILSLLSIFLGGAISKIIYKSTSKEGFAIQLLCCLIPILIIIAGDIIIYFNLRIISTKDFLFHIAFGFLGALAVAYKIKKPIFQIDVEKYN